MRTRAWLARFAALRRAPAVVGMRTSGGQLISSTGGRVHSSSSRLLPDPATIAIDLPASRPLPPPTATKPSAACSRYAAAPATMLRSVGLASTSPKRRGCRPAAASESKSPPTTGVPAGAGKEEGTGMAERGSKAVPDARGRGAPLKPLSATRSGRFEPRSRSLAGSSAARPAPNVTGTGKAQSAATLERPRLLFGNSARRAGPRGARAVRPCISRDEASRYAPPPVSRRCLDGLVLDRTSQTVFRATAGSTTSGLATFFDDGGAFRSRQHPEPPGLEPQQHR